MKFRLQDLRRLHAKLGASGNSALAAAFEKDSAFGEDGKWAWIAGRQEVLNLINP